MSSPSNEALADAVEEVLAATLSLARELTEEDADRPTDCPGWSVRDHLAHMVGLEQVLSGSPEPDIELPPLAHVVTDFDVFMEKLIHVRRDLPVAAIADELAGLVPRRMAQLRAQVGEGDPEVPGPFGQRPLSLSLPIRVFDLWAHEQDIRRALGRQPRIEGQAAEISLDRVLLGWTAGLPKRVEGVDGRLVVRVTAPVESETEVVVGAGGPEVTLTGDLGQVTRVFCGRGGVADVMAGDPDLAAAIRNHLAMTP
ncbi:MAG: maleylpyruvate isomerase family mycothiol-dependent enzyme [Actinomycetia bacterium]|nr:maleylpyruvate isomerase family mycothiol-dependent enzyme [Actinomycetes bacterium]